MEQADKQREALDGSLSALNLLIAENEAADQRYVMAFSNTFMAASAGFIAFCLFTNGSHPRLSMTMAVVLLPSAAICIATQFALSSAHKVALSALSRYDDPRIIGPLIDSLAYACGETRRAIVSALTYLLPRLREEDAAQLTGQRMSQLCWRLGRARPERDVDLMVSILDAVAVAGNRTSMIIVRRLAILSPLTPERARVMEAAERCLARLEARFGPMRPAGSLLRAAQRPEQPNQGLLKPAQAGPEQPPEQLLRPTQQED